MVEYVTGIDEIALRQEDEGATIVFDHPNYGGVWGDRMGGWVVAVLDCAAVDADRIAQLAGGPAQVTLIEVPYKFEQINDFSRALSDELTATGAVGAVLIDSTLSGRHLTVAVEDPSALGDDFGGSIPSGAFRVDQQFGFGEE